MLVRIEKERKFATAFKKMKEEQILKVHWLIENDSAYWASLLARTKLSRTIMRSRINLVVNIIKNWQWRVWSWLRMNASGRPNTCKSRGNREKLAFPLTTGARVRNAYATYLLQEYSPEKFGLILHNIFFMHMIKIKASVVKDGHAFY